MFRTARALGIFAALTIGAVLAARPSDAGVRLQTSNIDWAYVASTGTVRFHLRFDNPDPVATMPVNGTLTPQAYGALLPDAGPPRTFDVPPMAPNSFFDVFVEIPLGQLPPSAPTAGGPPAGGPCPPPGFWNGNVHIVWGGPGGQGQAVRHMGQVLVCPGGDCTFIHMDVGCAVGATWAIAGLCPGFSATLFEEDQVTPAPNPLGPAWHGWLCIRAAAVVPVPTTCCVAVTFNCAGQNAVVELCATTCDCNPVGGNPRPGAIDWANVPGTSNVRFHVRWDNPSTSTPTAPGNGSMQSQEYGVFLPDFGPIGGFALPAIPPSSHFDVFLDVPRSQLPANPPTTGGPVPGSPCPPDTSWNGNIDVSWVAGANNGQVNYHHSNIQVCPGAGPTYIHMKTLLCGSAAGMPWAISAPCPGFSCTLVNEDYTPAPNPVPPGWAGFICVSAAAATPVPVTCCFTITFDCAGVPGVVYVCATTCNCHTPPDPALGPVDWQTLPGGNAVRFHMRWLNPSGDTSASIQGEIGPQAFGVFLPDQGVIGSFQVPPIPPNSFFDVFLDAPLAQLPPSAPQVLPGGGPSTSDPCPPDDHWDGNVDIVWGGPNGAGSVNKHYGTLLLNSGGGSSFLHVISGCTLATGSTWSLGPVCPGFTVALENEDHSPAPAVLPPNWTGWFRMSAAGAAPGSKCCVDLTVHCGSETAVITVCAEVCYWGTLDVGPQTAETKFGIRSLVPNPTAAQAAVSFTLAEAGRAKLEIFDAAGHRVRTVIDGTYGAGPHSALWDGRDARGNLAKPGTYFVRLSAGPRSESHKLVLRP